MRYINLLFALLFIVLGVIYFLDKQYDMFLLVLVYVATTINTNYLVDQRTSLSELHDKIDKLLGDTPDTEESK
jgi:hypothetical protein